jgi:GNAT superfamily N-acetyltransferase
MAVEYRLATVADAQSIVDISVEFHALHRVYKDLEFSLKDVVEYIAMFMEDENKDVLVAVEDGKLVGLIAVYLDTMFFGPDKGVFEGTFYVSPKRKNAHIAANLLTRFEEWGRVRGAKFAMISVTSGMFVGRTKKLLETHGYDDMGNNMVIKL